MVLCGGAQTQCQGALEAAASLSSERFCFPRAESGGESASPNQTVGDGGLIEEKMVGVHQAGLAWVAAKKEGLNEF